MTALLAALSLQHKIEQYGAYAGIAAVFGLGVLSLLYFAQAREVKRLREWAGRAPERAQELEARVAADAQRRMTQPPIAPGAPATPAAAQQAGAPVAPGTPATAAAAAAGGAVATTVRPATTAPSNGTGSGAAVPPPGGATPATPGQPGTPPAGAPAPTGQPGTPTPVAREGQPPGTSPAPGQPGTPPAGTPASAPSGQPGATPGAPAPTPSGQPGTPTPAAPGQPGTPTPVAREGQSPGTAPPATAGQPTDGDGEPSPRPATPAAAGAAAAGAAAGAAAARPAAPLRAPTPSASLPPRTPAGARPRATNGDRSRGRLAAIVGAGLGVVAVLAVAGILIFGGGGGNKAADQPNTVTPPGSTAAANGASGAGKKAAAPKINRASFTVSVLNGTTVTGLARQASNKVTAKGYREGVVTNDTTNQQRPVTQIYYEPNAKAPALDVAKILGVKAINVKPMDANARVAADRAQVAVFVGTDKAQ
jgi:hypothetical protein